MRSLPSLFLSLFFLLPLLSCRQVPKVSLEGDIGFFYSITRGHLQTPIGGSPGTTSANRPTLRELRQKETYQVEGNLRLKVDNHRLWSRAKFGPDVDRDTTFGQTLISHGQTFLPNNRNRLQLRTYWLDFGYGYTFSRPLGQWHLEVTPLVSLHFFSFVYRLFGSVSGIPANRSYTKVFFRGGFETSLSQSPHRLSLLFLLSPPLTESLILHTIRLRYSHTLFQSQRSRLSVFLESGYEYFRYRDDQPIPNYLKIEFAPQIGAGIEWKF